MGCDCGQGLAAVGDRVEMIHTLLGRFLAQHVAPAEHYEATIAPNQVLTLDAGGNATGSIGPPVAGRCWYVERISKHASAGAPVLEVFVGPQGVIDPSFRRDWSVASADMIADEWRPVYVGPGEFLVLRASGGTAGSLVSVGLQIRVHRIGSPVTARY